MFFKRIALGATLAGACALASCSQHGAGTFVPQAAAPQAPPAAMQVNVAQSCGGTVPEGYARCFALMRTDLAGGNSSGLHTESLAAPPGYSPSTLRAAYRLPSTGGTGETVAIVDAYDDPRAQSDLSVYRSRFGLPSCTATNGCFKKVNESGGTVLPTADPSWSQEISLDLDMVSAICPYCHILLVEANAPAYSDLGTAVNTAVRLGAAAVSNSYGGSEVSWEAGSYDPYYNHPGHMITVSAGDAGYGVEWPAASRYVTAVGGTTLERSSTTRGWTETAWSGSGSGCSQYETKPAWQKDTGCPRRTVADIAAVADPNTGVAVYDSYAYNGAYGWLVFGGTSVSAPIVAAVYALAGNAHSLTYDAFPYAHAAYLYDVRSGSDGSCGGSYLCTAKAGYDGPTGLGTPDGTAAF
jgi:subtilase family serine protease